MIAALLAGKKKLAPTPLTMQAALDLRQGEHDDRGIHRGHQHAGHDDGHREADPLGGQGRGGRLGHPRHGHPVSLTLS
jgi:hypothetical protein